MSKKELIQSILQVNLVSIMTNEDRLPKDKRRMISQEDLFLELLALPEKTLKELAQTLHIKIT